MHAEDADADVDGIDVRVGEPLCNRPAAVTSAVRVCLKADAGLGEETPDAGGVLAVGLAAGTVLLEHEAPAQSRGLARDEGLREDRVERRRAVGHEHFRSAERAT